jgi:two-component system OmpR family response regulator
MRVFAVGEAALQILLAEDDAVSRQFLLEVLAAAGDVAAFGDGAAALAAARTRRFDLLLLDQRLPDMSGRDLLGRLRADAAAASRHARAIALTAGLDHAEAAMLRAIGFAQALPKPVEAARLLACIRGGHEYRAPAAAHTVPALDDDAALRALAGNRTALAQLRGLLRAELPQQLDRIRHGFGRRDAAAVGAVLHRLRASCGFCGATALATAATALEAAIREERFDEPALNALLQSAKRLREALDAEAGPA